MKVIIPMARKKVKASARFVPPSPLMNLVGEPILLRVLKVIKKIDVSEVIFIVDEDSASLKKLVADKFDFKVKYILQKEPKGVAHAVFGARKIVGDEPCIILFADSIVDANLKGLDKIDADAVIWTKQVEDPSKLGVVFTHDGLVTRLIEKPETPVSDLAKVGLYYFKNSKLLFDSIKYLIKNKILTKGAYQITDVLQIMINKGAKIITKDVKSWLDCGSKSSLLEAHKTLIVDKKTSALAKENLLIKPVFVEKGALIKNSVIGPNVSVGKNANITKAIISDSIIAEKSSVENEILESSFIGVGARVRGSSKKLNVKNRGVVSDE